MEKVKIYQVFVGKFIAEVVSENNVEYQTINQIGKEVSGLEDFEKEYTLDVNNRQVIY